MLKPEGTFSILEEISYLKKKVFFGMKCETFLRDSLKTMAPRRDLTDIRHKHVFKAETSLAQ